MSEKLVRDGIPEVIRASGHEPLYRVADESERRALLLDKLREEAQEAAVAAHDGELLSELADLAEVMCALLNESGWTLSDLRTAMSAKNAERGAFRLGLVLQMDDAPRAN